jgi:hypothetical protein
MNIDNLGVTFSESTDAGIVAGASGFAGLVIRLQNESASEVQSNRELQLSAGAEAGLGPYGGIEGSVNTAGFKGGEFEVAMAMKLGFGIGGSAGALMWTMNSHNTGY